MRVSDLFAWILERQSIYVKKTLGLPRPWTEDKILQQYSFCNVYRENDRTTEWIAKNWREPNHSSPDLWFAMTVARLINWPESLEALGWPGIPWSPETFLSRLQRRKREGYKVFSGAYIVSTNGVSMDKLEYLVERVLTPLWVIKRELRPRKGDTLESFFQRLSRCNGMGDFMSAQVIADVKYAEGSWLYDADDWSSWAAPGPGSRRGLNRVCGRPINTPWPGDSWIRALHELQPKINALMMGEGLSNLHAQDLQNCLCEFDKYERTRLGEGRPRATYPGR